MPENTKKNRVKKGVFRKKKNPLSCTLYAKREGAKGVRLHHPSHD